MMQIAFILSYLQDELEVDKLKRFENKLISDPTFAQQVESIRQAWHWQCLMDWQMGLLTAPKAQKLEKAIRCNPELQEQLEYVKRVQFLLSAIQPFR